MLLGEFTCPRAVQTERRNVKDEESTQKTEPWQHNILISR